MGRGEGDFRVEIANKNHDTRDPQPLPSRLQTAARRPEAKKIPSVPVGIFLARRVLRRDARAPVGRSSLCDDETTRAAVAG